MSCVSVKTVVLGLGPFAFSGSAAARLDIGSVMLVNHLLAPYGNTQTFRLG